MTESSRLFVYGSLRSGFKNPAYAYLSKYFHLVGEGVVHGKLYDKGQYPVAVAAEGSSLITGELYEANYPDEFKWAIDQLDDYEGLNVMEGETPMYKRELVKVFREDAYYDAWIYWYNGAVDNLREVIPGDVLKYLEQKNKP